MAGFEDTVSGGWCILRTAGRDTLRLVDQLGTIGIEAWTPRAVIKEQPVLLPKYRGSKAMRHVKVRDRVVPITPSFVFARAEELVRLAELSHRPGRMGAFTLFRYSGAIPLLGDAALGPLRAAETRAAPKRRRRAFKSGQHVRVNGGNFGGLPGTVVRCNGVKTKVCLGAGWRVDIASWHLIEDEVDGATVQPHGMRQRTSG